MQVIPFQRGDATQQPPPDLPSYLFKNRIVFLGMSLVPSVTELIMAELLYLQYEDPEKPIYMYINSTGTTKVCRWCWFCLLSKLILQGDVILFFHMSFWRYVLRLCLRMDLCAQISHPRSITRFDKSNMPDKFVKFAGWWKAWLWDRSICNLRYHEVCIFMNHFLSKGGPVAVADFPVHFLSLVFLPFIWHHLGAAVSRGNWWIRGLRGFYLCVMINSPDAVDDFSSFKVLVLAHDGFRLLGFQSGWISGMQWSLGHPLFSVLLYASWDSPSPCNTDVAGGIGCCVTGMWNLLSLHCVLEMHGGRQHYFLQQAQRETGLHYHQLRLW